MHKVIRHIFITVIFFAAIASNSYAGAPSMRPIEDFLNAQGQTDEFIPGVPDYVGWVDSDFITFALIDYAGLANAFIETESGGEISLGTRVDGTIIEHAQSDGKAEVSVSLFTSKALAWAFLIADWCDECEYPFRDTPLAFGARAQDVLEGTKPVLAKTSFHVTFMNSAPGEELPDLVQLLNDPKPWQLPLKFNFSAIAKGKDAEGRPAVLRAELVCETLKVGKGQTCSKEIVEIQVLPRNNEEDD